MTTHLAVTFDESCMAKGTGGLLLANQMFATGLFRESHLYDHDGKPVKALGRNVRDILTPPFPPEKDRRKLVAQVMSMALKIGLDIKTQSNKHCLSIMVLPAGGVDENNVDTSHQIFIEFDKACSCYIKKTVKKALAEHEEIGSETSAEAFNFKGKPAASLTRTQTLVLKYPGNTGPGTGILVPFLGKLCRRLDMKQVVECDPLENYIHIFITPETDTASRPQILMGPSLRQI